MSVFVDEIDSISFDDNDSLKKSIFDICSSVDVKMGKVMPGLRMALMGGVSGPDLITTMIILGKDQVKDRIANSLIFEKAILS